MFIAIDAKADIQGEKKGKLTPAQHAQINAWSLVNKTGILDCLNRCEATSLSYTPSDNAVTITFKSGYIAICGRIVECEENTTYILSTPVTGETTGKIILKYDLSGNKNSEFTITTKTGDLIQEDLNVNPYTGVYEFELYSYTATSSSVTLSRNQTYISDFPTKLSPLDNYDNSKGTIEQRLTNLGFKSLPSFSTNFAIESSGAYTIIGRGTIVASRSGYCLSYGVYTYIQSYRSMSFQDTYFNTVMDFLHGDTVATSGNIPDYLTPTSDIKTMIQIPIRAEIDVFDLTQTRNIFVPIEININADSTMTAKSMGFVFGSGEIKNITLLNSSYSVNIACRLKTITT